MIESPLFQDLLADREVIEQSPALQEILADPEIVRRSIGGQALLADPEVVRKSIGGQTMLADPEVIRKSIGGQALLADPETVRESIGGQIILAESMHAIIFQFLRQRFGLEALPGDVTAPVEALRLKQTLQELVAHAATCQDLDAFRRCLRPAQQAP